jgi:hypothetical protein
MRVVHFFDKLAFRTPRKLGKADMAFLRLNARKRYHRLGQPIRNANLRWLLVVVAPNDAALNLIAKRRYPSDRPRHRSPAYVVRSDDRGARR